MAGELDPEFFDCVSQYKYSVPCAKVQQLCAQPCCFQKALTRQWQRARDRAQTRPQLTLSVSTWRRYMTDSWTRAQAPPELWQQKWKNMCGFRLNYMSAKLFLDEEQTLFLSSMNVCAASVSVSVWWSLLPWLSSSTHDKGPLYWRCFLVEISCFSANVWTWSGFKS